MWCISLDWWQIWYRAEHPQCLLTEKPSWCAQEKAARVLDRHTGRVSCSNHLLGATYSIDPLNRIKTVNLVVQKTNTGRDRFILFLTMLGDRVAHIKRSLLLLLRFSNSWSWTSQSKIMENVIFHNCIWVLGEYIVESNYIHSQKPSCSLQAINFDQQTTLL